MSLEEITDPSPSFGELRRVEPREFWPHEGANFTPWLAKNIHLLGGALDLDLEIRAQEAPVGGFSLDLLAHDIGQDRAVIIENQLEITNHDHLGKLITYAAGFEASVIVWVSHEIREEHRQALEWLNLHTDEKTEFFGVVVEVLRIDDSKPAVNLKPVVFPNDWQKNIRPPVARQGPPSEKGERYRAFFQRLIDSLRTVHQFTNARKAQPQSWYMFPTGTSGIVYSAAFARQGPSVQIYIDRQDAKLNKRVFDFLAESKNEIEREFGAPLSWERLDSKQASRIALYRPGSIEDSDESLEEYQQWLVEHLLRLKKVFASRIPTALAGALVPDEGGELAPTRV